MTPELEAKMLKLAAMERDGKPLLPGVRVPQCTKAGGHYHWAKYYNPSRGKPCNEGYTVSRDPTRWCPELSQYGAVKPIYSEGRLLHIATGIDEPWGRDAERILAALIEEARL